MTIVVTILKCNKTYLYYKLLHSVSSKDIKTVHLNVTLCTHIDYGVYRKRDNGITVRKIRPWRNLIGLRCNRPFPSSPKSLFQSESKCEIFVMVISSNFNMNENRFLRLRTKPRIEMEAEVNSEMDYFLLPVMFLVQPRSQGLSPSLSLECDRGEGKKRYPGNEFGV